MTSFPAISAASASLNRAIHLASLLLFGLLIPAQLKASAQSLVISEFLASNATGIQDEDDEPSDWIEIYNPSSASVPLAGWSLTDDADTPRKWLFPAAEIPGHGFLLVFATGKDRTTWTGELHINFELSRDGEYLALVRPDGSIASQFAPAFPAQTTDVSYGVTMQVETTPFIISGTPATMKVPSQNEPPQWTQPDFNDENWSTVLNGIGYDRIPPGESDPSEPPSEVADVTAPGDFIIATSLNSPGDEMVENAIDDDPSTKYLNFDKLDAGLTVTPADPNTLLTGLRLTSANDAPERDPTSYLLTGSNDGSTFVEIARGEVPPFLGRFETVEIAFSNTAVYSHYHLIFPTIVDADSSVAMQIAEIEFIGLVGGATPGLRDFIETDIEDALFDSATSAYYRIPFTISELHPFENLVLNLRYDDGFAAWLNGTEIARENAPATLSFDALAPTNRFRRYAAQPIQISLNPWTHLLQAGPNVLAIQGFNDRADSPDFLLEARLEEKRINLSNLAWFASPTPSGENTTPSAGIVEEVLFSKGRGFYDAPFVLLLSCPTFGAKVRYTTDGSEPGPDNGIDYTGPIQVSGTSTIRAIGLLDGWITGPAVTSTYLFLDDVIRQTQSSIIAAGFPSNWNTQPADYGLDPDVVGPADKYGGKYARTIEEDLRSLPAVSIVMEKDDLFGSQGIYANPESRGAAWERPASIELLFPDDRIGFHENAGIRIQGGAFRRFDLSLKKSFRVVFKNEYGDSTLQYPLFGPDAVDEFENFILRANSNDAWPWGGGSAVYVRDAFAMTSVREMGQVASHSIFVHLYINGVYWGLYNPVERPDASFSASYHGGDRETWDALNQDSAPDGNYDAWNRMLGQLSDGLESNENYQRIQGNNPDGTRNPAYEDLLDVESMIDYMIMNFYVGNADWPHRNWWAGHDRNDGDGFKFYPWDTETALGLTSLNHNSTGVNNAVARPYAAARENADFRLHFADRVHRHFFNGGVFYVNPANRGWNPSQPENNRPAARFYELSEHIRRGIVGETARWGDQLRSSPYTRDEHWLRARDALLTDYFPQRSAIVLEQFRDAGLYPQTDAPTMNQQGGEIETGFSLVLTAPEGTIYYTTDGSDPRGPTAVQYTGPTTLNDLTTVKTRALNGSEWSALNEATFIVGLPTMVLTELHYHPSDPSPAEIAAGFLDSDEFEFIELHNNGSTTFDLSGTLFTDGIDFDFAHATVTSLAPGEYILLVRNRAAVEARYGTGLPIAGVYTGKLDNSGEEVEITRAGQVILNFTYGTLSPWPQSADGFGPSLETIDPAGDLNLAQNWRASAVPGGSPGSSNPMAPVLLEEIAIQDGKLHFTFQGRASVEYTVYSGEDITTTDWDVLQQVTPQPEDGRVEVTVDISGTGARFFRIGSP